MYFSKKKKMLLAEVIENSDCLFCKITLTAGWFDLQETVEMSGIMFRAWRMWSNSRWSFFSQKYPGVLRKFCVSYNAGDGMYSPGFILLALIKTKNKTDNERWRIRARVYMNWYSAWCSALKNSSDVAVNIEFLEKERASDAVDTFCGLRLMECNVINENLAETEKLIRRNHRMFSSSGTFRKVLNRHMSVGENKKETDCLSLKGCLHGRQETASCNALMCNVDKEQSEKR